MARTPSRMLPLGTLAPDFALPDAAGTMHRLSAASGYVPVLVMFICNHCPFVKHIRGELASVANEFQALGGAVFAINSNDAVAFPEDSPALMLEEAQAAGYRFPYLIDESQAVAKAYQAACTPDFYVFDRRGLLVYRGQFDDSRPGNHVAVSGGDLRAALTATLNDIAPSAKQVPSLGCNIKWKAGQEPKYDG